MLLKMPNLQCNICNCVDYHRVTVTLTFLWSLLNIYQAYHTSLTYTTAKLSCQSRLGWLRISPSKSRLYVRPGCGDTKYHHDLDGHKDEIFKEKYGTVQVHFGEIVLLYTYTHTHTYTHNYISHNINYDVHTYLSHI